MSRLLSRFIAPSAAVLDELARDVPPGVRLGRATTLSFDEAYYDTRDDSLECRGVTCRVRVGSGGRAQVRIEARSPLAHPDAPPFREATTRVRGEQAVRQAHPRDAALRWLATLVDPPRLEPRLRLVVRRTERRHRALVGGGELVVALDAIVVLDADGRAGAMMFEAAVEAIGSDAVVAEAERLIARWRSRHTIERATLDRRERARQALVPPRVAPTDEEASSLESEVTGSTLVAGQPLLDPDLSLLAFVERVMALAADARVPTLERVRFLAIAAAGLDEFHMVRVSALARAAAQRSGGIEVAEERRSDARAAADQLNAIRERVTAIHARQSALARRTLRELAAAGVRLREWREVLTVQQDGLRAFFRDQVQLRLATSAVTLAPGHPFPRVPHLTLSLAIVGRDRRTDTWHVSQLDLPRDLARFAPVPGSEDFIAIEEVVRANIDVLYPELEVEGVFAFRLTRGGQLPLEEELGEGMSERALDVLDSVSEATRRRPYNATVRLEVERAMPWSVRRIILASLRLEPGVAESAPGPVDVYEAEAPLGIAALSELASLPRADLSFPTFRGRDPLDESRPVAAQVAAGDVVAHHPYERFDSSVLRLLEEATVDPDAESIAITLYRTSEDSPVVDALMRAAREGKRVHACVELQARFDEERNVAWARRLEEAGVRVTYGVTGLKTHAKALLVERAEHATPRAVVHVSSGNYNARTALVYTDLSLLTARDPFVADARAFFAALLRGAAPAPEAMSQLVAAPLALREHLLARVRAEIAHARAGRPARIRLKLNGLSDAEMIEALYEASRAGVPVSLVVRGLCTLRPGAPDLSERITVVSAVGRFLEHARIYEFADGSAAEPGAIYIGSADWRPRNLRRRVELVAPVLDAANRAKLSGILDIELADPAAWELGADGVYRKRRATRADPGAQDRLARVARTSPEP